MNKPTYLSYSTLQSFSRCNRYAFYKANYKSYIATHRGAAMVKGKVVHDAIKMLHENPLFSVDGIIEQLFDGQEVDNPVGIDWGKNGRQWHIDEATEMLRWYWMANRDIDIISNERWFFRRISMNDGRIEWYRGRFDQVLNIDGKMVVRELKTGQKPKAASLRRDLQLLIQADACLHGYIATIDLPYIGIGHDDYHIHDFEQSGENEYTCPRCKLVAIRYNKLPAELILYHVPSLRPYAKDLKDANPLPRANASIPVDLAAINFTRFFNRLFANIDAYRDCEKSGIWEPTLNTGYGNPCASMMGSCEFLPHCDDGDLCDIVQDKEDD